MPSAHEINFDGIVGPTHNYAGLSYGNVASMGNKSTVSNPRQAALEGLAKMKFMLDLGVKQAVLPPQERPHLPTLRKLGFSGSDADVLEKAHRADPALLASVCSASSMWTANAATVSPSADTADRRVHFTPANLISQFHRSIEPPMTTRILRTIFADEAHFVVHDPLPGAAHLSDEGAANHMRFAVSHGEPGLEVFVYGRRASDPSAPAPSKFPARQTYEACAAIARNHLLHPDRITLLQQNPLAIDAGVFHNDVVAVANERLILHQQDAFLDPESWGKIEQALPQDGGISFSSPAISLKDAVRTYLFNSQLVTLPDGSMSLIAPQECTTCSDVSDFIASVVDGDPVKSVHYVDVRQSMHNGGGPACLRLRVVLTNAEIAKVSGNVLFSATLHDQLKAWIEKHYREELHPEDLRDPKLLEESRAALDELTHTLSLGSLYEFQRTD